LPILLAQKAGDSSAGFATLRMTAVTESGLRKTENGICENSLLFKFDDSPAQISGDSSGC